MSIDAQILKTLQKHCASSKAESFFQSLTAIENLDSIQFRTLFAGTPRRLGRQALELSEEERQSLDSIYLNLSTETAGNLGRFLLILQCPQDSFIKEILLKGDDFEKAICAKAINLRSDAQEYLLDIVNICRSNSTDTYRAIAIANPYPSRFFSDAQFNQLFLKCLFMQLSVLEVVDYKKRFNQELGRALYDLYCERTAAGRPFAPDCLEIMKEMKII